MRSLNTFTRYSHHNIRNRLATLQRKTRMHETTRKIIQSEIEAASLYWFLEAGGDEKDFEAKFNGK